MASHANTILQRAGRPAVPVVSWPAELSTRIPMWVGVLLLALATMLYVSLLTQGARLFDNDYDWINSAQASWTELLADALRPCQPGLLQCPLGIGFRPARPGLHSGGVHLLYRNRTWRPLRS